jgi:hypothetical protein
MPSLQRDILAIIESCRSALAVPKKSRPRIDAKSIEAARKIVVRLKEYGGVDDTLPTITLNERRLSWWEILSAMEAAKQFLEHKLDRRQS